MEGSGPLAQSFVSSWPTRTIVVIHETSADATMVLVSVHVIGVLLMSLLRGENLIKAMIVNIQESTEQDTGQKTASGKAIHSERRSRSEL
jgi:cytochrome b